MSHPIRRYWRLLRGSSVTREDFMSNRDLRRPPRRGENDFLYTGISVWDDLDAALLRAIRRPAWVAGLDLAPGAGIAVTQTGADAHHFTIHADPDVLLVSVAVVHRVE